MIFNSTTKQFCIAFSTNLVGFFMSLGTAGNLSKSNLLVSNFKAFESLFFANRDVLIPVTPIQLMVSNCKIFKSFFFTNSHVSTPVTSLNSKLARTNLVGTLNCECVSQIC